MSAIIVGLNLTEAMASLPSGVDRDFACRLLMAAEAPFICAWIQAHQDAGT